MSTVKLTFAANPGLGWVSGDPTPDHSYASVQLLDKRPHNEQLKAYYTCDEGRDIPLTVNFNEINKTVNVSEIQAALPCNGNYNPKVHDILFYRVTPSDYSYITFTDGAKLTAATLNLDNDQLLHLIQELLNRFEETNPYWQVLPEFTCVLTASIQCDLDDVRARMLVEEANIDDLQTLVFGWPTDDALGNSLGNHKWSYPISWDESQPWASSAGYLSGDPTLPQPPNSNDPYVISDLYEHSAMLTNSVKGLRNDINFMLGQQPSLNGAYVTDVGVVSPCDSEGNAGTPESGCSYTKLSFTLSTDAIHEVIYSNPPYITGISGNDISHQFSLTFTYCDGSTSLVGPFSKYQGPQGIDGIQGEEGERGNGFYIWRKGPLSALGDVIPVPDDLEDSFNNLCYAVTSDATGTTNAHKGEVGHLFEQLSPTFGGPGGGTGSGNYTGYLLRLERREPAGEKEWYCTNMQFPLGADSSSAPLKYYWDDTVSTNDPVENSGQFFVDTPSNMGTVTQIKIPYVDATGTNVEALLEHLLSGDQADPDIGIATLILSRETSPGQCATFRVEHLRETYTEEGGGLVMDVVNLTHSDDTPFVLYPSGIQTNDYDRISFDFSKHGQIPAIPAMFTVPLLRNETTSTGTNSFHSLIKIPEGWTSIEVKNMSVTFSVEINGSTTSTPTFRGDLVRVGPQEIRSYPCNDSGTDWYNNYTLLERVQSITDCPPLNIDDRYTFDDLGTGTSVSLPGNANGYMFMRIVIFSQILLGGIDATLNVQVEGKVT
jgi:hypothetical protein